MTLIEGRVVTNRVVIGKKLWSFCEQRPILLQLAQVSQKYGEI
jgi:hypothetical protein